MESEFSRAEASVLLPELVEPPPRRIQVTGNGITLAVVTVVIVAIAVICVCFVATEDARQLQTRAALRSASDETRGKVVGLRNPFHGLKEYLDYTFVADGRTYTGEAIVPLEDYHSIGLTSSLSIRYRPENPALSHPTDWEWSAMQEFDPYFVVVLIAGLGCILFIPPQILFERRLAAEGVATIGVVTKCSVSGKGRSFIDLKYDFRTQDGKLEHGRGRFQYQQEIGANILLLYLPQKPQKNIPYPISTWRIAKS